MDEKKIHIYYINKIKNLDEKIFEYQDDDAEYVNWVAVRKCEREIEHWLDKAKITDQELRREVLRCINWYNDRCCDRLEELGWEILKGELKQ